MVVLIESLSESIVVHTSSLPPVVVKASHVEMDSLTLHLDPPAQLGTGTHIENFQLKYSAMDENGTFIIENTERTLFLSPTSLQVTVPYLLPGVLYSFQTKVKYYRDKGELGGDREGGVDGVTYIVFVSY